MSIITPDLIIQPFANSAGSDDITTIPQSDADGFVNFTDGYTSYYEISLTSNNAQAKAVERQAQNYLFNALTKNAQAWQNQAIPPWYSTKTNGYDVNATVMRLQTDGVTMKQYRSLVAANVSDPISSATWEYVQGTAEMIANIPMPAGGPGANASAEVISSTSGVDANNLTNGVWEFSTDAVAQACANMPTLFGAVIVRGMFESKSWTVGSSVSIVQRYTSVDGRQYLRSYSSSAWSAWNVVLLPIDAQNNRLSYTTITAPDSSAPNAYTGSLSTSPVLRNGQVLWVYLATPNASGATTIALNGGTAYPIVNEAGQNLSANEMSGAVCLMWYSPGSRWRIVTGMGIKSQSYYATATYHLPTFKQVQDMIAAIGNPDWANVQNKPNVAIQNTTPTFTGVELSSSQPFVDFHFGSGTTDYSARLIANADNQISLLTGDGKTPITFNSTAITSYVNNIETANHFMNGGQLCFSESTAAGVSAANQRFMLQSSSNGLYINGFLNGAATTEILVFNDGTPASFRKRPTFAGAVPWDNANFDPNTKVTGYANSANTTVLGTGNITFQSTAWGYIASLTSGYTAPFILSNGANTAASTIMGFLRDGQYGVYFGLDTDNVLKIGGWSMGAASYPILHSANLAGYLPSSLAALATAGIGMFCLLKNMTSGAIGIGSLVAGGNLRFASAHDSAYDTSTAVPGTWRCQGYSAGVGSASAGQDITLYQRVS